MDIIRTYQNFELLRRFLPANSDGLKTKSGHVQDETIEIHPCFVEIGDGATGYLP